MCAMDVDALRFLGGKISGGNPSKRSNCEEALSVMWQSEMVWGKQPFATARYMFCSTDLIAETLQARLDNMPCSSFVVTFKVSNILQDHKAWPVRFL